VYKFADDTALAKKYKNGPEVEKIIFADFKSHFRIDPTMDCHS